MSGIYDCVLRGTRCLVDIKEGNKRLQFVYDVCTRSVLHRFETADVQRGFAITSSFDLSDASLFILFHHSSKAYAVGRSLYRIDGKG